MLKVERKFGVMDDWAKQGQVDGNNYSQRAEGWCAVRSKEREGVHPTVQWSSPEFLEWWEYFSRFIGRIPIGFQRIIDNPNSGHHFTVPERRPKWFDERFTPTVNWMPPRQPWEDLTEEERADVIRKLWRALAHGGIQSKRQDAAE